MFVVGAFPALLALIIRARLREPQRWLEMKAAKKTGSLHAEIGSYVELFGHPRWRKNAIRGMLLACAGVIGLWGIGFFSIDLLRSIFRKVFEAQGMTGVALNGKITVWTGLASFMLQLGAFIGMFSYGRLTQNIGRKPAFAAALIAAFFSTVMVFWYLKPAGAPADSTFWSEAACFHQIFWMMPIMGACQLALFAGYAIYFPELFPVHLRSTGTSFCYNVGRFLAATGPTFLGLLTSKVFYENAEPLRNAGVTMCVVFILGLIVLPFLPETRGQPLPEDERGQIH
jgi:MFS family permease